MKPIVPTLAATALWLVAGAAFAADSGERTSMPQSCSERDVNCVIQDGPAMNRRGQLVEPPPAVDGKGGPPGKGGITRPGDGAGLGPGPAPRAR